MRITNLESRVFVALVVITSAFFLWMVRSFLLPIFWAAVFAVLFQRLFLSWNRAVGGRRGLAALLSVLTVVVVVLIPFALLVGAVAQQAVGLYQRVAAGDVYLLAPLEFAERSLPIVTEALARYGVGTDQIRSSVESAAGFATQYVAGRALALGQNLLVTAILFVMMLYLLFFFFRDGDRIVAGIVRAVPMGDDREQRLMRKFAQVSRATVKGTMVVAVVQGALGGILFALVGVQAAVFWAVIMGILSLLPAVGPALVWGPAAVILVATGEVWGGIFLLAGGGLVVGLVDNILRPILVGRETQMPDYLVLLATLGGLSVFGLAGFVAGPIVAALFLVMWEMFADEYAELDSSAPPAAGDEAVVASMTAGAAQGSVHPPEPLPADVASNPPAPHLRPAGAPEPDSRSPRQPTVAESAEDPPTDRGEASLPPHRSTSRANPDPDLPESRPDDLPA